jgi:hypothetical protein
MPVFSLEAGAGREGGFPVVAFPDFIIARLAGPASQLALFENVAFAVALQLEKASLLTWVHTIGQDDQDFTLHAICHRTQKKTASSPIFNPKFGFTTKGSLCSNVPFSTFVGF